MPSSLLSYLACLALLVSACSMDAPREDAAGGGKADGVGTVCSVSWGKRVPWYVFEYETIMMELEELTEAELVDDVGLEPSLASNLIAHRDSSAFTDIESLTEAVRGCGIYFPALLDHASRREDRIVSHRAPQGNALLRVINSVTLEQVAAAESDPSHPLHHLNTKDVEERPFRGYESLFQFFSKRTQFRPRERLSAEAIGALMGFAKAQGWGPTFAMDGSADAAVIVKVANSRDIWDALPFFERAAWIIRENRPPLGYKSIDELRALPFVGEYSLMLLRDYGFKNNYDDPSCSQQPTRANPELPPHTWWEALDVVWALAWADAEALGFSRWAPDGAAYWSESKFPSSPSLVADIIVDQAEALPESDTKDAVTERLLYVLSEGEAIRDRMELGYSLSDAQARFLSADPQWEMPTSWECAPTEETPVHVSHRSPLEVYVGGEPAESADGTSYARVVRNHTLEIWYNVPDGDLSQGSKVFVDPDDETGYFRRGGVAGVVDTQGWVTLFKPAQTTIHLRTDLD